MASSIETTMTVISVRILANGLCISNVTVHVCMTIFYSSKITEGVSGILPFPEQNCVL